MDRRADLIGLLREHRPAGATESRHVERMLALLDSPSDPFCRDHYEPGHFTASAFVLSPDRASVLLIFHSKLRRWLQPGGHVDPNDPTIVAAALRELREETGIGRVERIDGVLDVDVHVIPARDAAPEHSHFDVRFLLRTETEFHRAASDAVAARWVPLQAVSAVDSDASVMRAVGKIRDRVSLDR
jgi:8-oxo-dGTP pyrophosphatase MutT (NUDIX family)